MYAIREVGACPCCGDELYLFKTKNRKRLVKCMNEDCEDGYFYVLPQKGTIECTGIECPKDHVQIMAVIPNIKLTKGKYAQSKSKIYFWAKKPCFTCSNQGNCLALQEAKEDYELE